MPKVGWTATVKAVTAAWPEMKATAKTNFIKALGAEESENGRRIRLSVARGLFKIPDIQACTKLIVGVAKEIRDKESGNLPAKDSQSFANVMIGKGKPWIAQLPLADLKPAEADLLVHCATVSAFSANLPPITLVGVLRWAGEAGRLESLHESVSTLVAKSTSRWSGKWTAALRKEVPALPELIAAGLKPEAPEGSDRGESDDVAQPPEDDGLPAELKGETEGGSQAGAGRGGESRQTRQRPVYVSKTIPPKDQKPAPERAHAPQSAPPPAQSHQPAPQQQGGRGSGPAARTRDFNVGEALRQLDAHIAFLKSELKASENKLRDREDDRSRQSRKKLDAPVLAGEPTPEELARLNLQLEARITELQSRIDDLAMDAEARAVSAGAFAAAPETNPDTQLRTLLGLKLAEVYADFCALETEDRDLVVPQHYRTLTHEIFEVLKAEHIPLEQAPKE